jgi:hypothetical protein
VAPEGRADHWRIGERTTSRSAAAAAAEPWSALTAPCVWLQAAAAAAAVRPTVVTAPEALAASQTVRPAKPLQMVAAAVAVVGRRARRAAVAQGHKPPARQGGDPTVAPARLPALTTAMEAGEAGDTAAEVAAGPRH